MDQGSKHVTPCSLNGGVGVGSSWENQRVRFPYGPFTGRGVALPHAENAGSIPVDSTNTSPFYCF